MHPVFRFTPFLFRKKKKTFLAFFKRCKPLLHCLEIFHRCTRIYSTVQEDGACCWCGIRLLIACVEHKPGVGPVPADTGKIYNKLIANFTLFFAVCISYIVHDIRYSITFLSNRGHSLRLFFYVYSLP